MPFRILTNKHTKTNSSYLINLMQFEYMFIVTSTYGVQIRAREMTIICKYFVNRLYDYQYMTL
jgi:hypothetical protein